MCDVAGGEAQGLDLGQLAVSWLSGNESAQSGEGAVHAAHDNGARVLVSMTLPEQYFLLTILHQLTYTFSSVKRYLRGNEMPCQTSLSEVSMVPSIYISECRKGFTMNHMIGFQKFLEYRVCGASLQS